MHFHCCTGDGIHKSSHRRKKILALEADSCAGGNFILDVQNYDVLFSACIVNGFLATQIPAAMVGSGCCQFCLCWRDKTSSECFSSEFIRQGAGRKFITKLFQALMKLKEKQLSDPLSVQLDCGILGIYISCCHIS